MQDKQTTSFFGTEEENNSRKTMGKRPKNGIKYNKTETVFLPNEAKY